MKTRLLNLASAVVFVFAYIIPVRAMNYYVDQNHPGANDQNTGTSDHPWKTISKANQTLVAGDTLFIKAGTYNTYIAPSRSGASSQVILPIGITVRMSSPFQIQSTA